MQPPNGGDSDKIDAVDKNGAVDNGGTVDANKPETGHGSVAQNSRGNAIVASRMAGNGQSDRHGNGRDDRNRC